jgi:glycogen operon protein
MSGIVSAGAAEPLGVTPDGAGGANVAVHAPAAERLELCRFDAADREVSRTALPERTGGVWHARLPDLPPGARYGFRAHGPWAPHEGLRFNPAKLLIDPYALALDRVPRLHASMFGQRADDPFARDDTDSGPAMPKAVVTAAPPAAPVAATDVPWARTVIYELHVRGFTMRHPDVPPAIRGTFAGLAHPAAVAHLVALGVTTVEVMPCAAWIEERHLKALGLTNYWGYNPVALLAPDPRVAPGGWPEVHGAVASLAAAGIETIVDVVLNHTGEGDQFGPTLSQRGLDNAGYYRLRRDDRAYYVDDAGTGSALACDRPHVVRLCMDALRTWAVLGRVHGFRFDLGVTLGRRDDGFDPAAPLLTAISQDPLLRGLKLISEPWDIGQGGYRLGAFPAGWGEWNDRYRDDVRRFWRGDGGMLGALATRLAGSADLLGAHRRPSRGVNFITAHDGFTLADLVSYQQRHNLANGEDNRDGSGENNSWNNGVEGPTEDPAILAARRDDQAALLATLLFSRGTPMLSMGAEMGQSQQGNNNAYCQDGPLSWLDWDAADRELLATSARLVRARLAHPALYDDHFLGGAPAAPGAPADAEWFRADGSPMTDADWHDPGGSLLIAVFTTPDSRVAIVINRGQDGRVVSLPPARGGLRWDCVHETVDTTGRDLTVRARAVMLFAEAK